MAEDYDSFLWRYSPDFYEKIGGLEHCLKVQGHIPEFIFGTDRKTGKTLAICYYCTHLYEIKK